MQDYRLIPLHGKHGKGKFAKVSLEDYERLSQYRYTVHNRGYVWRRDGQSGYAFMHHDVLERKEGFDTDHINGDLLDNRRENLRYATEAQNTKNRRPNRNGVSRYKGVSWSVTQERWLAYISVDGRRTIVGLYGDEMKAAEMYDAAARYYHKDFAKTNFEGSLELSFEEIHRLNRGKDKASSSYYGVNWHKQHRKWLAWVPIGSAKKKHVGLFDSEEEAARARDAAARALGVKVRYWNFPLEE